MTEATNLSVGIVDEDGSALSRQIAEALRPPTFQPPVQIPASDIDPMMDKDKLLFVVEIPPNFEADLRAQRKTGVQVNVDATAVAQAGNGASYLRTAIANEIQRFLSGKDDSTAAPINLVTRAAFNPNLKTSWFSAMTQVINQITMLTVILTGAALIREREQGTVEHLLVMPIVAPEIMIAKMIANGLVILVAATLSIQFVVHWWIGSPINGSLVLFVFGAAIYSLVVAALGIMLGTLATTMGQFGLLAIPVLMVTQLLSGSSTPMESMPVWLQYIVQTVSPTPHFVLVRAGRAVPRRGHHARLARAPRDGRRSAWSTTRRPGAVPARHFRRVKSRTSGTLSPRSFDRLCDEAQATERADRRDRRPAVRKSVDSPLLLQRGRAARLSRAAENLLGHAARLALRNQPVDEQGGEAVHQPPGGERRGALVLRLRLRAGDDLLEEPERLVHRLVELGVAGAFDHQRPEHQAEQPALLERELDIGEAHADQRFGRLRRQPSSRRSARGTLRRRPRRAGPPCCRSADRRPSPTRRRGARSRAGRRLPGRFRRVSRGLRPASRSAGSRADKAGGQGYRP